MFGYTFPGIVGVSPFRYHRASIVEISIDVCMSILWLISPSLLVHFGSCTPFSTRIVDVDMHMCIEWAFSITFGYAACLFHLISMVTGILDIRKVDPSESTMFARGNWTRRKHKD